VLTLQDGGDEYSLLVNLRRLYELQLSTYVPIGNLYEDIVKVLRDFTNLEDEVCKWLLTEGVMFPVTFLFVFD
jgi:cohesin complex subunit SA-1/2